MQTLMLASQSMSNASNRQRTCVQILIVAFATLLLPTVADSASTQPSPANKTEILQFVGAWKISSSPQASVMLIHAQGDDQLILRGQDQASAWNARCARGTPGQFVCEGTGETFATRKLFLFESIMEIRAGGIEEKWSVDGRKEGKLGTKSGSDRFDRIGEVK